MRAQVDRLPPPVRPSASPSTNLREGYTRARACSDALGQSSAGIGESLHRSAAILNVMVCDRLFDALRRVLTHPTMATLRDAFRATEAVLRSCDKSERMLGEGPDAVKAVLPYLHLSGLRAAVMQIELGLEAIPLLPACAPDYPAEDWT